MSWILKISLGSQTVTVFLALLVVSVLGVPKTMGGHPEIARLLKISKNSQENTCLELQENTSDESVLVQLFLLVFLNLCLQLLKLSSMDIKRFTYSVFILKWAYVWPSLPLKQSTLILGENV